MENSVSYRIYMVIKGVYLDSKVVKFFSNLFTNIFNVLVNSKVFLALSNPKSMDTFKESVIWKSLSRIGSWIIVLTDRGFIKKIVNHSFFIRHIKDIVDHKNKHAINRLILIPMIMLVTNMGIKIVVGNFTIIGNKYLIAMTFILALLYFLQLDYWTIVKNSKIIRFAYEIFYDEPFDHHI